MKRDDKHSPSAGVSFLDSMLGGEDFGPGSTVVSERPLTARFGEDDPDEALLTDLLAPGPLPGWTLGRPVGDGVRAEVREAFDASDRRFLAKLRRAAPGAPPPEALAREALALHRLEHPCVPRLVAVGLLDGRPAVVRTWFDGEPLHPRLREFQAASRGRARAERLAALLGVLVTACEAVHHAHERGVLHLDLHPHNLLVTPGGGAAVLGWGNAQRVDRLDPGAAATASKPGWIAPEQAAGRRALGPTADVFTLGAVLFELLTNRSSVPGRSPAERMRAIRGGRISRLADYRPDLSPAWAALVDRALEPDPAGRLPSLAELADGLADRVAAGDLPTDEGADTRWPERSTSPGRRVPES